MTPADDTFTSIFGHALRGHRCVVRGIDHTAQPLPVEDWIRDADADDLAILAHCTGTTIDVGCGPGRLSAALASTGRVTLGIDVVSEAVLQARGRGAAALRRDVFGPVPGEGRWESALLADGNIGIGGDPETLLRRVRGLLSPLGQVVVELAPPGVESRAMWARLECAGVHSRPFRWAVVGIDGIAEVAERSGLVVQDTYQYGARWCAVLKERV